MKKLKELIRLFHINFGVFPVLLGMLGIIAIGLGPILLIVAIIEGFYLAIIWALPVIFHFSIMIKNERNENWEIKNGTGNLLLSFIYVCIYITSTSYLTYIIKLY